MNLVCLPSAMIFLVFPLYNSTTVKANERPSFSHLASTKISSPILAPLKKETFISAETCFEYFSPNEETDNEPTTSIKEEIKPPCKPP